MGWGGGAKGEPGSPTAADAAGTGATGAYICTKLQSLAAPAAKGVDVHAAIASDNAAAVTTGMTNPAIPRSLQVVFAALWDGGDVTIVGTDQFDQAVTETIADTAGSTVEGVKIFKTVTSINQQVVGAGGGLTATVQTGPKLGLLTAMNAAFGIVTINGVAELGTWDGTYHAVTPTTAPNGSRNYVAAYPVSHTHTGPSHTHTLS